jgi:hypothetical protein
MAIDFQCSNCNKPLRVPDTSQGQRCVCPSCKQEMRIPTPLATTSLAIPVAVALIDVACPYCQQILNCDEKLLGTRGHCAGCGNVFTIQLPGASESVTDDALTIPFACPNCKKLFEGAHDAIGRKGKCNECQTVFVIEKYVLPKPAPIANKTTPPISHVSRPSVAKPAHPVPTNKPTARPSKPANSPSDPFSNLPLDRLSPPPSVPNPGEFANPDFYSAPIAAPRKAKRKTSGGGGNALKWILGILATVSVVSLLICGGLFASAYLFMNSKRSISIEGYTVQASGSKVKNKNLQPGQNGDSIRNLMTQSEFAILSIRAQGNWDGSADGYLEGLRQAGAIQSETPVSRCGLSGIRITVRATGSLPRYMGEIFSLPNNKSLILMYINGQDHPVPIRRKPFMTRDKIETQDNPEAFFSSLTKL